MGLTLATCNHCPLTPSCDIRKAKLALLRGSGVTYARFHCAERRRGIKPGDRVEVSLLIVWTGEDACEDNESLNSEIQTLSGTAMEWFRSRKSGAEMLRVWLDTPTEIHSRVIVAIHPDRLKRLDEPARQVCEVCGRPEGLKRPAGSDYYCERCDDSPCLLCGKLFREHDWILWPCEGSRK